MTVDERVEWCLDQKGGRPLYGDEARAIIRQALRDQIEDCAKENYKMAFEYRSLADRPGGSASWYGVTACERAAKQIRALAGEKGE